ncbi:hypothetical protein IVA87_15155 [Bradyrhizobium sp. 147]|uniref:hypothetical protein n=1 Tax=Bradyrhizobium sp. 147 TaxID=2782623 RepID=UPI001FF868C9|nr:hypothetical protein [Bradyrhizobium sp. 147]MCK1680708.1 hypothetical protein [Bradyrhizobium sp. 147]
MHNWKKELDALVAQTTAFTESLKLQVERPKSLPGKVTEEARLNAPNYDDSEREEIKKRVERFQAHQERFKRERENYADSLLRRIRPGPKT